MAKASPALLLSWIHQIWAGIDMLMMCVCHPSKYVPPNHGGAHKIHKAGQYHGRGWPEVHRGNAGHLLSPHTCAREIEKAQRPESWKDSQEVLQRHGSAHETSLGERVPMILQLEALEAYQNFSFSQPYHNSKGSGLYRQGVCVEWLLVVSLPSMEFEIPRALLHLGGHQDFIVNEPETVKRPMLKRSKHFAETTAEVDTIEAKVWATLQLSRMAFVPASAARLIQVLTLSDQVALRCAMSTRNNYPCSFTKYRPSLLNAPSADLPTGVG
eukprot:3919805-Amphidinium_carterae.1